MTVDRLVELNSALTPWCSLDLLIVFSLSASFSVAEVRFNDETVAGQILPAPASLIPLSIWLLISVVVVRRQDQFVCVLDRGFFLGLDEIRDAVLEDCLDLSLTVIWVEFLNLLDVLNEVSVLFKAHLHRHILCMYFGRLGELVSKRKDATEAIVSVERDAKHVGFELLFDFLNLDFLVL